MTYHTLEQMRVASFEAMLPSEQLTVVEAAKKYVIIRQPGAHVGPWSAEKTPYLIEPQEVMTSLDHTGMVFVGPARTGKSQMFLNWLAQTAKVDPVDMMIIHMTQASGRDWSKSDLEKMFRNSPELKRLLLPGRSNDNTFDKEFLSGMRLTITWPTANNLSGKTLQRLWLMDYDRMKDDIDGEGNAFDLAKKRATTFKRFGMTVAESSPNPDKEIESPKWLPKTPHQGPPIRGIFELYNRGDRRRWYWRCPSCTEAFEPSFKLLNYPDSEDHMEAAEMVTLRCPNCQFDMLPDQKDEMNQAGRWVKDGMILAPNGEIVVRNGMRAARSEIASFWMKGPAAAFQDWKSLVLEYLRADEAYETTGDESPLKKTVTTDQGEYYIPRSRLSERLPEDLKDKAEDWGSTEDNPTVPAGVRFLIATVDVQGKSFVVQVHGFTADGDIIVIDGFKIRSSERLDGDGKNLPIDPAAYGEDWDQITKEVMQKSYRLDDASGRSMSIKLTGCDSGGGEGVTFNAYAYWMRLRARGDGMHRRLALVKGDGTAHSARTAVSWPDSKRTGKLANARGEVPVIRFNANLLKDQVAGMLSRRIGEDKNETGAMIRYPNWMPDWFYSQVTNEVRSKKGWEKIGARRNESFDLLYYALGLAIRPIDVATQAPLAVINVERLDFHGENCPTWAREWDANDLVFAEDTAPRFIPAKKKRDFGALAKDLA